MIKVLLREARRLGMKNVEVEFLSTNRIAIHTYQQAGFREVGRIPKKVHRDKKFSDSLAMARDI
jgi:ribosomal protein S18 acetylase RimI-like enzyme